MTKNILLSGIILMALCFTAKAQKTAFTLPEVNKILKEIQLYINVELDDSVKAKAGLSNSHYFNPLINHIDYNVIGKGGVAVIHDDELQEFILKNVREGVPLKKISRELITEYIRLNNTPGSTEEKEDIFHIGGFFTTEVEQHQEDDGKLPLITLSWHLVPIFVS